MILKGRKQRGNMVLPGSGFHVGIGKRGNVGQQFKWVRRARGKVRV